MDIYSKIARTGDSLHFEQGSEVMGRYFEVSGVRVGGEDSRKVALIFKEVSERKRAEKALEESQKYLERILEVSPSVVYIRDHASGGNVFVNRESAAALGYTSEEVLDMGEDFVKTVMHPDDLARTREHQRQLGNLKDGETKPFEYRMKHKDGTWRWFLGHDSVFERDESGRPRFIIGAATDISERKHVEEQLQRANTRFQLAEEAAGSFSYEWDLESDVVTRSPNLKNVLGYEAADLESTWEAWVGLYHPDHRPSRSKEEAKAFLNANPQNTYSAEYRVRHKRGHYLWLQERVLVVRDEGGKVQRVIGQTLDISEREQAARALRDSEQRLQRMVNVPQVGVLTFDYSGALLHANDAFLEMLGYAREEFAGKTFTWRDFTPSEHVAVSVRVMGQLRETGRGGPYEKEYFRKDGSRLWMTFVAADLGDGTIVEYALDISERKRLEEALQEADKRKDEFLAVLAHELRNPLAPIRMGIEIMKRSDDKTMHQEARAIIERQTDQIVRLVDDLLDVSRITRGTINLYKEPLTLAEVMTMALEAAKPLMAEKNHQLLLGLPVRDIHLEGDKTRLCQVFLNLLTNAAKYSNSGSKVTVSAELEGREVVVRVQDTGIGLAPEALHKVFDLFARVDSGEAAKQEGLGIGLHLVKRLVEMHGGSISVSSPGLGQGSEFAVRLPVIINDLQAIPAPVIETQAKAPNAARRVLVVDDYEANRKTLTRMLRLMGHEVTGASNGQEALELLGELSPDLILLDINMPLMSGYEVARRIKENPEYERIKLVALTGYGAEEDLRKAQEAGFHHHLVKPVDMKLLEELLSREPKVAKTNNAPE